MEKRNKLSPAFWAILLAAAGIYALLSLSDNIWADEAYTFAMLHHSFLDICRITSVDSHPPLYYLAAKLFTMPFGYSEFSVRMFSGVCCLVILGIGGWQITRLFNQKMGLLFMVLFALYPFALERAVETRMYPIAALGIFLCGLFAYRAWTENKWFDWAIFAAGGLCAAYSHYFALASAGIIYGLFFLCILIRKRQLLKPWLITAGVTIVLYLPWLGKLIGQLAYKVDHEYWIAPITPATLVSYVLDLFSAQGSQLFALFFGALMLWLFIRACIRREALPLLAVGVCVITVLFGVAASLILRPVFIIRYLSPCAPLLIFFLAWGLAGIRKDTLYGAAVGFLLVGFAGNLVYAGRAVPRKSNQFGDAVVAQTKAAQAYVLLNDDAYHVHQTAAYYNTETPIYTPETMGDASPYPNVHPMEELDTQALDTILVFTSAGSRPTLGFPQGYDSTLLGTYQDYYYSFDLWMLEKAAEEAK